MASKTLAQLYEEANLIVSTTTDTQLPQVLRGFCQIDKESKQLAEKTGNGEPDSRTHYFLSKSGVNYQELIHNVNTLNTKDAFTRVSSSRVIDIDTYLGDALKKLNIQDQDQDTKNAYTLLMDSLKSTTEPKKKADTSVNLFELWETEESSVVDSPGTPTKSPDLNDRLSQHAAVISDLNDARLLWQSFPIVSRLSALTKSTPSHNHVIDAWDTIEHLAKHKMCYSSYFSAPHQSQKAIKIRRQLITACKSWLEEQFIKFVDEAVYKHAREATIGGVPSFPRRLRAFVDIVFRRVDRRLEYMHGTPKWVFVYLLIRSGHIESALEYVRENNVEFGAFRNYLEEFCQDQDKCLQNKATRDAILADFQRLKYAADDTDPYKLLLYKLIGRCEVNTDISSEVIQNTEDYLWLHLSLVREDDGGKGEEYRYQHYDLQDLQKRICDVGKEQFDDGSSVSWVYFKMLLLTLQFERGINYLFRHERSRVEATHFAIAYVYLGMARIPLSLPRDSKEILILDQDGLPQVHFARLIYVYIRQNMAHSSSALHYYYLLSLLENHEMTQLCWQGVRSVVLSSPDAGKSILGTLAPEHTRRPGVLDRYKTLIGIANEQAYVDAILNPVAQKFEKNGRIDDAIQVYELAANYDPALALLQKQLADTFANQTISEIDERIESAMRTLGHYQDQQHIGQPLHSSRKKAILVLIDMLRALQLYHEHKYDQALDCIARTDLVPLRDESHKLAYAVKLAESFEDSIGKNMSDLLLMVMDILYQTWKMYEEKAALRSQVKMTLDQLEESARAVLSFAGMIHYKLPPETVVKLNKLELTMSIERAKRTQL